jgi:hypothetical protein|tara:strand:+ start:783 stop:1298 length:516 start_codon:yes stop_codon:yes gene_type:complete
MKKFKELSGFLNENEYWDSSEPLRARTSDYGIYRIEDQHQLGRINSFIEGFMKREFIDPKHAMSQLRHKLNLAGLDFELSPNKVGHDRNPHIDEGTEDYKILRFGGEFGTKPDHDLSTGFYKSDGISPSNGGVGMVLRTTYSVNESGMFKIDAMIVPDVDKEEDEKDDDDI